jgi:hypothetical protein
MIPFAVHPEQMKPAFHADDNKNRQNGEQAPEKYNLMNRITAADISDNHILDGKNKPTG